MKYLKVTLALFVATFLFAVINAKAQVVTFSDITIPAFKGIYQSKQQDKYGNNLQYIKKTKCTDDWSGDGRVILSKLNGLLAGNDDTAWVVAEPNKNVSFGSKSKTMGAWKLWLESNKNLMSTASFWGTWTVN